MVLALLQERAHVQRCGPVLDVQLVSTNRSKSEYKKGRKKSFYPVLEKTLFKIEYLIDCSLHSVYVLAVCTPVCANSGTCSSPGTCTCTALWTGTRCATRKYQQIQIRILKETKNISYPILLKNLFGQKLLADYSLYLVYLLAVCTPVCSNSGTCSSPGTCTCTALWTGTRCTTRKYQQIQIKIPKERKNLFILFLRKLCSK